MISSILSRGAGRQLWGVSYGQNHTIIPGPMANTVCEPLGICVRPASCAGGRLELSTDQNHCASTHSDNVGWKTSGSCQLVQRLPMGGGLIAAVGCSVLLSHVVVVVDFEGDLRGARIARSETGDRTDYIAPPWPAQSAPTSAAAVKWTKKRRG